ncbi:DUF3322 domain-containing protein [Micromonospora craniellae]|uniref:DUF3322 domain-containing protein n=1 Tax=Micromonospora craniellae TaxID=2294034 RepID=A0A372FQD1_9ACTN|nr:hypothetical protein D0Q02_30470 [Micromonospora craniellae]
MHGSDFYGPERYEPFETRAADPGQLRHGHPGITSPAAAPADDGASPTTPAPSEQPGPRAASWPHDFPLGQPTSANLAKDFATAATWAAGWRAWSAAHDTPLRTRTRRVHNTDQELPTHLVVADPDHGARLCARHWPQRLERARRRATLLAERFPHLAEAGSLTRRSPRSTS